MTEWRHVLDVDVMLAHHVRSEGRRALEVIDGGSAAAMSAKPLNQMSAAHDSLIEPGDGG